MLFHFLFFLISTGLSISLLLSPKNSFITKNVNHLSCKYHILLSSIYHGILWFGFVLKCNYVFNFFKFPFIDRIEISKQEFREDTHPVIKRLGNKICKFKF